MIGAGQQALHFVFAEGTDELAAEFVGAVVIAGDSRDLDEDDARFTFLVPGQLDGQAGPFFEAALHDDANASL